MDAVRNMIARVRALAAAGKTTAKAGAKWIQNGVRLLIRYCRYGLLYVHFRAWYWGSLVVAKSKRFRSHALLVFYGVFLVVTSFLLTEVLSSILKKDGVTFFTSAGAMFGGIIAIFFSVSTLLMQSAAQSTSAGFYKLLGRDVLQEIIYWVIAFFAVTSFILAEVFSSADVGSYPIFTIWVARIAIIIIGLTFLLLFVLYFRIFERINPRSAMVVVREDVLRYMNRLAHAAKALSNLMTAHPSFDEKRTAMAKAAGLSLVKNNMSYVSDRLDHLFDYHNKLVKSEERKSARIVIDNIVHILKHYFGIVSEGSLLVHSPQLFFAAKSDSEKFLTAPLQALVSAGGQYINQDDEVGISHIIWKLCHLTLSAADIKYTGTQSWENPIFSQCLGYLTQLTDVSIDKKSLEGTYQAGQAYSHIARKAIDKRLHIELGTIYTSLNKIAYSGLIKKQPIVWQQAATTYGEILQKLVSEGANTGRHEYKTFLENYEEILVWAVVAGTTEPKFREIFFMTKMDEVFELIPRLAGHLANVAEIDAARGYSGGIFELLEENRRMLRRLSEKFKSGDHFLLRSIGNNIRDIGLLILELLADPKWAHEHDKLRRMLGWYIHQPGWFIHHATGTIEANAGYDSLTDSVAKIGIAALEGGELETAKSAVEILSKRAVEMLEKESPPKYGYTEPRIMVKVCYIGILALKLGQSQLLDQVKAEIKIFEAAYKAKWFPDPQPENKAPFSPSEEQLRTEVLRLREKVQKHSYRSEYSVEGILDLPEDWIVDRIDLKDFDSFTRDVWGFYVLPSPLDPKNT
jgi:hypothetical protein